MAIPISKCRRQFPRDKCITQITLIARPAWEKFTTPAATLDISSRGLRILSAFYLKTGQRIDVLFPGDNERPISCKVAWTKPAGTVVPGEAGLTFLEAVQEIPVGENDRVTTEPPALAA
jgi:hypothetical protein